MITPNMAVALCTIINFCITTINFILIAKLNHYTDKLVENLEDLEDETNE